MIPPGFVTVKMIPNIRPNTNIIAPDHTSINNVSPQAFQNSGNRFIRLGSNSCVLNHLHAYIFVPVILHCSFDSFTLAIEDYDSSADHRARNNLNICKNDIYLNVKCP